jgi:peptide chain release factor 1
VCPSVFSRVYTDKKEGNKLIKAILPESGAWLRLVKKKNSMRKVELVFTVCPVRKGVINSVNYSPKLRVKSILFSLESYLELCYNLEGEFYKMFEQLDKIEKRYLEIDEKLAQPEVATDIAQVQTLAKERSQVEDIVRMYRQYKQASKELDDVKAMSAAGTDEDMAAMIKQEIAELQGRLDKLTEDLKQALVPKDPNDEKDIIVEIRAGTGGDEAAIFASDLYRMYSRYAQNKGWKIDVISVSESGGGGLKEIIFEVRGKGAYSRLKYESGVHRVQRVPTTEASGRIHTSTATVAVLPKAEEVDIAINPDDLRIDIFHSGGAGGQNVNKVASAIRVTHFPTGIVVVCQDERSQLQNKIKAMSVLRTRLLDMERRKQEEAITSARRSQVGTGERSEKIRTYNYPQDRISDHRIDLTVHNLPKFMDGEIDNLVDELTAHDQAQQLEGQQV